VLTGNILKRILLFPILGGIIFHLVGACLSGIVLMFLHYQNNFNANPDLISAYWETLLAVGQLPLFGGIFVGVIAAFTSDWPNTTS
jgi:hypothetical protein